jgi:hypothetical protein
MKICCLTIIAKKCNLIIKPNSWAYSIDFPFKKK